MEIEALRISPQISTSLLLLPSAFNRLDSLQQKSPNVLPVLLFRRATTRTESLKFSLKKTSIRCSGNPNQTFRTCKNCKTQFDPDLNHPRACSFHTAHFGGETKRKFESVYSGGNMNTPNSGQVFQYWHCCGSEDPFDPGCTAAPHSSYDD